MAASTTAWRRVTLLLALLTCTALTGGSMPAPAGAQEAVPTPTAAGPIAVTPESHPFFSAAHIMGRYDYVEEEYFVEGTARQFAVSSPGWVAPPDGPHASTVLSEAPYRIRIVVRRPADPGAYNGTVVQEWLNVTGGYEQGYDWFASRDYFMRSGMVWVGVGNQTVGVNDLRSTMPERYESLTFPGDMYSEDVFSQVGQLLRAPGELDPLSGMRPQRFIASGHSQSGTNLTYYYNNIQPMHDLFDGFMPRGVEAVVNHKDVQVPFIRVQTETESIEGPNQNDPDGAFYRRWEVAGASHADWYQQEYREHLIARDRGGSTLPYQCVREPFSRIPFQYVLNAAYESMQAWIEDGTEPPTAPRFEATPADTVERDDRGNALGAVRVPEHDVPTATNTGDNEGAGFCFLYGSYTPFDPETLQSLYADHATYEAAVNAAADARLSEGLMLPTDANRSRFDARHADLGVAWPERVTRVAGASRIATAAAISAHTFPGADTVVIARADEYPDALAGAPLARDLEAPLLLSHSDGLPAETLEEIGRLGAAKAVLLGGTAALSTEVAEGLSEAGLVVERVAGANRFATAVAIAAEFTSSFGAPTVFLPAGAPAPDAVDPSAGGWPDALAVGPYAAHVGAPILLTAQQGLPSETAAALERFGVTEAVVVGGPAAVGDAVVAALEEGGHGPRRLAGPTRYDTNAAVVMEAVERGMRGGMVWAATGQDFPDALAAGAAAGAAGDILLLVDPDDLSSSPVTQALLTSDTRRVRILGGSQAITPAVEQAIRALFDNG